MENIDPRFNGTDSELIEKCNEWVSKLCKSGGRAWSLRVPVDYNYDPDMLFIEASRRLSGKGDEIATLRAEIERLRYALQSAALSLKIVSGQRVFYGGDRVCQFCGTERDAHHSAMCPKTNLSIVQEALTKQDE